MPEPEPVGTVLSRVLPVLRCSALPLALRCPGSVRATDVKLNQSHAAADVGTAAHEALRALAESGSVEWSALPEIAQRHQIDAEELRILCALATKLWPHVSASFKDALAEVALAAELVPGVTLSGHVDLLSIRGTVARAGDWKTGRKDSDYSQQMRGYATLVLLDDPQLTEVTVTVLWVREGDIENYTMTRAQCEEWLRELIATVVNWDEIYRPGTQCNYCPRSHECPAANALIRRDVAAIRDIETVSRAETELGLMKPADIVELLRKAEIVASYALRVRDAIKEHVQKHGDVVANGVRLSIETQEQRQLVPLAAWPVLEQAGFTDEDFAACIDMRISRVEKRAAEKAKAEQRNAAAAVRTIQKQLAEADAVTTRTVEKLTQKRA